MLDVSALELEVAGMIVDTFNFDMNPADIDPQAPLFREGLGLDSIDMLELALVISKRYGFQIRSDDADNAQIFSSLRSLADTIAKRRVN